VEEYLVHKGWRQSDLEDICFTGLVAHEDLPRLYNSADLFVAPSFYEGFGTTLLEAMACGCPIVASRTGSCPEITDGAAVLADPFDPSDFATKIKMVLENDGLKEDLRRKGLQRAKFFSREKTASLTLQGLTLALQPHRRWRFVTKLLSTLKEESPPGRNH
jgi:glycosyltransferase involved in cell wall biosynthesis